MIINFDIYIGIISIALLLFLGINIFHFVRVLGKTHRFFGIINGLKFLILTDVVLAVALPLGLISIYRATDPKIESSYPRTETVWDSYSKPIELNFNIPVDSSRLTANINPKIEGTWIWEPYFGISRLTRRGRFIPKETLLPDQRIVIYITGIGRIGNRAESHEYGFVFDAVRPPEIKYAAPFNNAVDIKQDQQIKLYLTKVNENIADWDFLIEPTIEYSVEYPNSKEILIKPKQDLELNNTYNLSVFRKAKRITLATNSTLEEDSKELIFHTVFNTQDEPLLRNISPKGSSVKANSKIRGRFMTDMNQTSVENNFSITPKVEGEFFWENLRTFVFTPNANFPKATKFTMTFVKGIETSLGIKSDKEAIYDFETIGAIKVTKFQPERDQIKVSENTEVKVTFDQELNKESAQQHFVIEPNVAGNFSWQDSTLIFEPSSTLQFNTKYIVKITSGVQSVEGLDSIEEFSSIFTTRNNQVIISMPLYYQPQYPVSFSCNMYTAKMALAWKGYNLDTTSLITEIGYDSRQDDQGRWLGNPNENYVGNADGSWGYGAYWFAIQKLFKNRNLTTEIKQNWNVNDLARSLDNGKPVMMWRYNGTSKDKNIEWGTSGVYAINGQHGGVVSGYRGTPENPTAFYINDPWFGLIWMDTNTFDYYWSRLNRVGMIIY